MRDVGSVATESASSRDTDPFPSDCDRCGRREAGRRLIIGAGAHWTRNSATEMLAGAIPFVALFASE